MISISQAAAHLGVSTRTIRRWITAGELPATRIGPKLLRIHTEDLERLGKPIN
ncbi:helix-turn-helix domain-containing protein [Gordonia alkanivorans]|nr:helix-turn-helix domain-containing protein [Gordonia alkanivorans]MDH3049747.1 helix-turn-helix domain-containing protein [Gordonia alkanivorans]